MEKEISFEKKAFTYRGKTMEELLKMDTREFSKYVPANQRRSILRKFDVIENFVKKSKLRMEKNRPIRTHLRELVIVPSMVGMTILVHNGKDFLPVKITEEMLGHRLGEFSLTRGTVKHGAPGIGATRSSASMSVK